MAFYKEMAPDYKVIRIQKRDTAKYPSLVLEVNTCKRAVKRQPIRTWGLITETS